MAESPAQSNSPTDVHALSAELTRLRSVMADQARAAGNEPPRSTGGQRTNRNLAVVVAPPFLARLRMAAALEGISVSEWVRRACRERLRNTPGPPDLREVADNALRVAQRGMR